MRDRSLALYTAAQKHAEQAGILLADTKFEFGTDEKGNLLLIDELESKIDGLFLKYDINSPLAQKPEQP